MTLSKLSLKRHLRLVKRYLLLTRLSAKGRRGMNVKITGSLLSLIRVLAGPHVQAGGIQDTMMMHSVTKNQYRAHEMGRNRSRSNDKSASLRRRANRLARQQSGKPILQFLRGTVRLGRRQEGGNGSQCRTSNSALYGNGAGIKTSLGLRNNGHSGTSTSHTATQGRNSQKRTTQLRRIFNGTTITTALLIGTIRRGSQRIRHSNGLRGKTHEINSGTGLTGSRINTPISGRQSTRTRRRRSKFNPTNDHSSRGRRSGHCSDSHSGTSLLLNQYNNRHIERNQTHGNTLITRSVSGDINYLSLLFKVGHRHGRNIILFMVNLGNIFILHNGQLVSVYHIIGP